jgi:hypothetical protein
MTMHYTEQNEAAAPWQTAFDANIAMKDILNDFTLALLDAEADMAWDGSFTTYSGKSTICAEGNSVWGNIGCFDLTFDIMWDEESLDGSPVEAIPIGGTIGVSTMNAGAMFTFGTSASNPSCFMVAVDEDGHDVYEIEEEVCD